MRRVAGSFFLAALVAASVPVFGQTLGRSRILAQATISPSAAYPSAPNQVASADLNGYTPAPVPDSDEVAPVVKPLGPPQAQWSPNLFRSGQTYRGEGFVPGSSVQASQQRNVHPAPGISLNVPLE